MKKEYMKPVMESEMFVANEYVGACYVIEDGCNRNHLKPYQLIKNVSSEEDALKQFDSIYGGKHITYRDTYLYFGNIDGDIGNTDNHSTGWLANIIINIYNTFIDPDIEKIGEHHDLKCNKTGPNDQYDNIGPNAS